MKTRIVMSLMIVAAASGSASAGTAQVSSIAHEELSIAYQRASGEPATATLSKATSRPGYTSIKVEDRGSVEITVTDRAGDTVAIGTVVDNGSYLVMPSAKGHTLVRVGSLSLGGTTYGGAVIVNALPDAYKIDLFGHYGKIGLKNVKIAKAFDVKQAFRIPDGDDRFKVSIHHPDGTTTESFGMVDVGRYHVIHETYDDKVTVSSLGYIEPPAKPRRANRKGK